MLDTKRHWFKGIERKVGFIFSKFHPNFYTILSLVFALCGLLFIIKDLIVLALIFFILAAGMDFVDGSVARFRKITTKKGAYLDTVFDRYVEAIFLFGLLFLPFPVVIFPSYIWIFLILFGAMMTTYAKSAAKEKELLEGELKGGIFSRAERLIMSFIILLSLIVTPQYTIYLIILMAVLSNIAAIQRIYRSLRL